MTKRLLVVEADDHGAFFLAVASGTMTVGGNPQNAEGVLRGLRISRIHCEVEVDDDPVVVSNAPAGGLSFRKELHLGDTLQLGRARLRLEAGADEGAAMPRLSLDETDDMPGLVEDEQPPEPPAPVEDDIPATALVKRLMVVDGADKGQFFFLPDDGTVTVGKSNKHADIVLHDLYVARIHCEVRIDDDKILVTHVQGTHGTLVNGQVITGEQELRIGEVLRVGNSHMQLELVPADIVTAEKAKASLARAEEEEVPEEEIGLEVIEDGPEAAEERVEALQQVGGDQYALPHTPIDELLKLEGQPLGHFRIANLLGRGHSGLVFRAVDTRNNHTVALKVLSPDFPAADTELQRFVKALKTATQLHHPHLVTLQGAGKTGPYCWIAREYVEGESGTRVIQRLVQRLKEGGKIDWAKACRTGVQLGKALCFLHKHRVTHGNITPRNVLFRQEDRMAKLADLMLNHGLEGSRLQKAILGKKLLSELPYMAPEQTDPHDPVTPAADVYALGGVLYALLTGQPPYVGDTPTEVRAQIREGRLVKPSKLHKGIPADFEALILKMLARRPEDRFPSGLEMLAAVEKIAQEHGITA
jgi:pSer/pThr/pTyr-binding forkhead associated (FHA) protein